MVSKDQSIDADTVLWNDDMLLKNHSTWIKMEFPVTVQCDNCDSVYPVKKEWEDDGSLKVKIKPHICIWLDDETNDHVERLKIKDPFTTGVNEALSLNKTTKGNENSEEDDN